MTSRPPGPTFGRVVRDLVEQGLVLRLSAAEGIEVELPTVQIEFRPDEPLDPSSVDVVPASEDVDSAAVARSPDECQAAPRWPAKVDRAVNQGAPDRGSLDSNRVPPPTLGEVCRVPGSQLLERRHPEPSPDLALPAPVERLDRSLEAALAGRREDRYNLDGQTEPDHGADRIRMTHATNEARCVVELGIAGSPGQAPALRERSNRLRSGQADLGPRVDQSAMERDTGQDVEVEAAQHPDPLDDVEAVELSPTGGDLGQIPAHGWRRAAHAVSPIENPVSLKDPPDRPDGRDGGSSASLELVLDRRGAVLAQNTRLAQFATDVEDERLKPGARPGEVGRSGRPVTPVDVLKGLITSSLEPQLDGCPADLELLGNGALAQAGSNEGNDLTMLVSRPDRSAFSTPYPPWSRFGIT